jgi:SAM-dependent methyltransferase
MVQEGIFMTVEEFRSYNSETERYRCLTVPYCVGNGVDVGSGGMPVVPWAIQIELPSNEYAHYHSGDSRSQPMCCYRGYAEDLPFKDGTLDFVYSSHLLEDFLDWYPCLREWTRVLRKGGKLIILMPDKKLWAEELARGRVPNCSHRHEPTVGELSTYANRLGWKVIKDELTDLVPGDYSLIGLFEKL